MRRIVLASSSITAMLAIVLITACGGGAPRDTIVSSAAAGAQSAAAAAASPDWAPIDLFFRFNQQDTLPIADRSLLPVQPGVVTAHWYTFQGWYVVVFEGLNLSATGPVCLGAGLFGAESGLVERVAFSPTAEGACDAAGAGDVPLAAAPAGVRICGDAVAVMTQIPGDLEGTLFATIARYPGDGTGVALSGRLPVTYGALPELDPSLVDCGPVPVPREMHPPEPPTAVSAPAEPAPSSRGLVAAADRVPPPRPSTPTSCVPAEPGVLQDVTESRAAPYFVRHPLLDNPNAPTVVFLPGGNGGASAARRIWVNYLAEGVGLEDFRLVIPYSNDAPLIDDAQRIFRIVDEVLGCYGGDPSLVHLAGFSNGGLAAFALMAERPEYFATLLGAPGAFPVQDPNEIPPEVYLQYLGGRAVFNGVGSNDQDWRSEVIATHNALVAAGVESVYVEFPGQGHGVTANFDETVFFDFWRPWEGKIPSVAMTSVDPGG